MRNQSNWNFVDFECKNCGTIVKAFPSRNVKYCSNCAKDRRVEVVCKYCGKTTKQEPSRKARYCNRECWHKGQFGKKYSPEFGRKVGDTKLSMPLSNPMSSRRRASKYLYPVAEPCEECGESDPKRIDRHHIDRDPFNNDRTNIAFLCKLHHQRVHKNWEKRKAWINKNL